MKEEIVLKKSLFVLSMLFLFMAFPLFPQEENAAEAETPLPSPDIIENQDENQLYVIAAFEFDIKGRTRPYALIRTGEFRIGEKLQGLANLEAYISDKTQVLVNQRILKDNANITYAIGEQQEDDSWPVTLLIKVEDSFNIIALPRPFYKTDSGFDLTIKARDYNFLGTMNPLRVDFGYQYDENQNSSFQLGVFSNTPFRAFGYNWNVRFDNTLSYRPQTDETIYYQNNTGLSMELPFGLTTLTVGFEESLNFNEENTARNKIANGKTGGEWINRLYYGKDFQHGLYMSSKMYASWEIPTGFMVSRFGELTYTPGISATFNHQLPDWPLQEFLQGPFLGLSQSLGFERIDWHANYRDGLSVSAGNAYTYDFSSQRAGKELVSLSLNATGIGHFIISDFFAISTRLMYRHWFYHEPDYYTEAGNVLRGMSDKRISATGMLSLNMDFPLRILRFTPSKWFNKHKLSFFDFEFHLAPVIDLALYNGYLIYTKRDSAGWYRETEKKVSFHPKNIAATSGLELVVFSEFMRNLYIRLGLAWNLRDISGKKPYLPSGENREIYLIMGHFY